MVDMDVTLEEKRALPNFRRRHIGTVDSMIALAYAPLRGILRYVLEGGFSLDGGVENGVVERVVGRMGDPRVALLACRMIAKAVAGTQVGLPIAWAGAPGVVWWKQVAGNGTPAAMYLLGPRMAGAGDERAPPLPSRWETEHAERRQRMLPRPSLTVLEGVGLLRTRNADALRKITCHRDTKKESTYRPKGAHAGFKGLVTSMDKRGVVGTTTQEAGVTVTIPVTRLPHYLRPTSRSTIASTLRTSLTSRLRAQRSWRWWSTGFSSGGRRLGKLPRGVGQEMGVRVRAHEAKSWRSS